MRGLANSLGSEDGTGSAARFFGPVGIAVDGANNVFVGDGQSTVRRITPAGVVTTVGSGAGQSGVAVDSVGNLFVSYYWTNTIRKGVGPATLNLGIFPVLTLNYSVGMPLRIEVTTDLSNSNSWTTLTNLTLPSSPYNFVDTSSPLSIRRYYRAVQP